ncbi:hypothetical protein AB0L54_33115 [Streptomyces sp. NPDC052196]|uniref:hypothetical protein n=1 Tax=Streptomyces sp. NPDC052196 TaxID=3156691 RepID=UPI00342B8128
MTSMRRTPEVGGYTRTILPPRTPMWPTVSLRSWGPLGGDELRVRRFLWRVLGVGADATRRHW